MVTTIQIKRFADLTMEEAKAHRYIAYGSEFRPVDPKRLYLVEESDGV